MNWDKDEHIEEKIKESLEYIDNNVTIKPDYLAPYKMLVQQTVKKKKQKYIRETLAFLITLIVILFIEIIALTSAFTVFIILQAAAGVMIPLSLIILRFVKARREETT